MIRSNLEEKKKIEGAIEKMSIGGDRLILETIGRQI
jgi:predicted RNA-binding protein